MEYRKEIDGLRAVSVIAVILYHAGFKIFKGGYVGVDVFFVISGYLITSLIVSDIDSGSFSLLRFYDRRIRRIFPPLFVVILCSIPFAWVLLPISELIDFSYSISSISLLISNIYFIKGGDYFKVPVDLKPMLHTWSLGVEEQFYLFFPITLIWLRRLDSRSLMRILLITFFISLISAHWGAYHKPVVTYYLLPTRIWEMVIGGIVAILIIDRDKYSLNLSDLHENVLSIVGMAMIFIAIIYYSDDTPFPSFYALLPAIGGGMVILFAKGDGFVARMLGTPFIVTIGLMSYSAYLWHQPVMVFGRQYCKTSDAGVTTLLIILIFVLSWLSWRFIEIPFRDKERFSHKSILLSFSVFGLSFLFIGIATGISLQGTQEMALAKTLSRNKVIYTSRMDERLFIKYRIQYETKKPDAIVIGSSRVMQIGENNYHKNTLNLAVSGASLEDDIAIASMAIDKFAPEVVFISADPWLFNSRSGHKRWMSISKEYSDALTKIDPLNTEKRGMIAASIIHKDDFGVFAEMINALYGKVNKFNCLANNDLPEIRTKIRHDGSRVYNLSILTQTKSQTEKGFDNQMNYGMSEYEYSDKLRNRLERFIDHYSPHHKICLVLSPYHPLLYRRIKSQKPIILEIEKMYRNIADRKGISIVGSYDPGKLACLENQFYDGMHPSESAMAMVLGDLNKKQSVD